MHLAKAVAPPKAAMISGTVSIPACYRISVAGVNRTSVPAIDRMSVMVERSSQRLRQARVAAGYESASSAADRFSWKKSTYASHENGQTAVPNKAAVKYARAFKVSAAWILTGEGSGPTGLGGHHIESSEVAARLTTEALAVDADQYGAVSSLRDYEAQLPGGMPEIDVSGGAGPGGNPSQAFTEDGGIIYPAEAVRGEVVLPDYVVSEFTHAKSSRIHWIRVRGDSMAGTLEPGDRVGIDTTDRTIGQGGVFVIGDLDGEVLVKRLRKVNGRGDKIEIVSDNPKQGAFVVAHDEIRIIGRVVARISRVG